MKTALLLTAGLLVTGVGAAVLSTANAPAPAQQVITELKGGTATFQHVTAEKADEFTFTTQVNGIEQITVTYSDGVVVRYTVDMRDNSFLITTAGDTTKAALTWDGQTAIIKTENNTTKLGGFRTAYDQLLSNRQGERQAEEAWQAARAERMAELNELPFDGMVSELSVKACSILEGKQFISNYAVTESINEAIGSYEMGSENQARWNNMNGQLRRQNVAGAMNWDCNNAMMVALENNLTWGF